MNISLNKFKPSAKKPYLIFIAGLLWFSVGIMLNAYAYKWLNNYKGNSYIYAIIGLVIAAIVYYFGFKKIARKNIVRITHLNEKPCVFAFMSWKGYLMVAVMMKMGNLARTSSFPKQYLSIVYIIMGFALAFSSFHYFSFLLSKNKA
jgi:hypothetical protein